MLAWQFSRYFVAGCAAVALHLCVLVVLVEVFAVNATVASGTGFVLACIANYLMQQAWVFRAEKAHKVFFVRYATVTAGTFVLNIGLFWFGHHVVGIWYPMSQLLSTGIIFILNFAVNRQYTFRASSRGGRR